jgi:hypothetical protein
MMGQLLIDTPVHVFEIGSGSPLMMALNNPV